MTYRLSGLAELDLTEIWSYVAEDAGFTTADRLLDDIFDRFELLAEQPMIGRLRPEFGSGVRSFTVENHVIYYRHNGDIQIARVLHGRRDQAAAWIEWARLRDQTDSLAHMLIDIHVEQQRQQRAVRWLLTNLVRSRFGQKIDLVWNQRLSLQASTGIENLVAQIFPRWNRLAEWLSRVRHFDNAA